MVFLQILNLVKKIYSHILILENPFDKKEDKKYNGKKEGKTMTGKPETKVEVEPEVNEKKK